MAMRGYKLSDKESVDLMFDEIDASLADTDLIDKIIKPFVRTKDNMNNEKIGGINSNDIHTEED